MIIHKFDVRGRHDTVYSMELPAWLPIDILQKMVKRFRQLLHDEFVKMLMPPMTRHSRKISESDFSSRSVSDSSQSKGVGWEKMQW
jgi:hypothetical protein